MISDYLDELIEKYPNRDRFYSLQQPYFYMENDKISCTEKVSAVLAFSDSAKELFELACKEYPIDSIDADNYYTALDITVLTGYKSGNIEEKPSRSEYAKDLRLNRRTWYRYCNKYYTDDELALEIIDRIFDNVIFVTDEYDIELGSKSQNTIKITHKRDNTTQNILAVAFTEHPLMKEIFSIYAHKIKWESK